MEVSRQHPLHEHLIENENNDHVHHLGDGVYAGNPKFRFNSLLEGSMYRKPFKLDIDGINIERATFSLYHRGAQLTNNTIYINNQEVATLPKSPEDGSFEKFEVDFPPSLFHEGFNEFKVEAGLDVDTGNLDDFEFKDAKIDFKKSDHLCPVIKEEDACGQGPGGPNDAFGEVDTNFKLDADLIDDCGNRVLPDGSVQPLTGDDASTDGDVFTNPNVKIAVGRKPTNGGDNNGIRRLAPEIETRDTDDAHFIDNWGGW
jgi:hypothetical protein